MGKVKSDERDGVPLITIGRAAAATGLTPKAVRLYEGRGLLPPLARTAAGYRLYSEADIGRLRFIAAARRLGLHIDQITQILAAAHGGERPCTTTHAILDQRISEIDAVMSQLTDLRTSLTQARDDNTDHAPDHPQICPMIEIHTIG